MATNLFDQFDEPAQPANVFDQFDEPTKPNVFDQFDAPPAVAAEALPPEEQRLREILGQHRGEAPPPYAPSFAEEVPGPANIVYPPSKVAETEQQLEESRIPFEPVPQPDWTERALTAFQEEGVGGAVRETGAALGRAGITPDLPRRIAEFDFGASPMPLLQTSGMGAYAPWGGGMAPREERSLDEIAAQWNLDPNIVHPAYQKANALLLKTGWNIAAGIYNFMNTPEGVATTIATGGLTAGGPVAKEAAKLVTLGFSSQMVKGAIDHAKQGDFQGMLESLGMAGIVGKAAHEMGQPVKAEPRATTKGLEPITPIEFHTRERGTEIPTVFDWGERLPFQPGAGGFVTAQPSAQPARYVRPEPIPTAPAPAAPVPLQLGPGEAYARPFVEALEFKAVEARARLREKLAATFGPFGVPDPSILNDAAIIVVSKLARGVKNAGDAGRVLAAELGESARNLIPYLQEIFDRAMAMAKGMSDLERRGGMNYPDKRISTRSPWSPNREENPHTQQLELDVKSIYRDPVYTKKIANAVRPYMPKERIVTDDVAQIEQAIDFFEKNKAAHLELLKEYPWAQRAMKQYEGYNIRGHQLAKEYGHTIEEVLGGESAISPQTPPDESFSMIERLMKVRRDAGDTVWDSRFEAAMKRFNIPIGGKGDTPGSILLRRKYLEQLRGKRYDELQSPFLKAMWARTYDHAFHSPYFRHITPEGTLGDYGRTKAGTPTPIRWRGFDQIAKGIQALDGVPLTQLLETAKVSSYYNSKIAPNMAFLDWVADTHDIGSSWMMPVSGDHPLVKQSFGGPASSMSGHHGTSALHAEAGRRLAEKNRLIPSELQAGIWSHQQGFMSMDALDAHKKAIADIKKAWEDAHDGILTEDQARAKAIQIAKDALGKAKDPTWAREFKQLSSAELARARSAGYAAELPGRGGASGTAGPGVGSELAAGIAEEPLGVEFFSSSTDDLNFRGAQRALGSNAHTRARLIDADIKKQLGLEGPSESGIGAWLDGAEDSVLHLVTNPKDFRELEYAAAIKGKLLRQKSMLVFMSDRAGPDAMHSIIVRSLDHEKIHRDLLEAGIENHTLVGEGKDTHIVVVDLGNTLGKNIAKVADKYGVKEGTTERGTGSFIGDKTPELAGSRERAAVAYDAIRKRYEGQFPARRHYTDRPARFYNVGRPPAEAAAKVAEVEKVTTEQKRIIAGEPSVPQEAPVPVKNRLDAAGDRAAERLRRSLSGLGIVPDNSFILADLVTVGAAKIGRGIRNDAAWTRAMIAEFGPEMADKIRPYLKDIYRASIIKHDQELQDYQRATSEIVTRGVSQEPTSKAFGPEFREPIKVDPRTALKRLFGTAARYGKAGFRAGYREAALKGQTEIRDMQKTLRESDQWLSAEASEVEQQLRSFAGYLPLNERAKFIPQILRATRRPSQFAMQRDPLIMRRRAEDVLNNIAKAVYDYKKKEIVQKTSASLKRIKKSATITVPERLAIQNIERQFHRFKDQMSLEMLQRQRARIAQYEELGRDLFRSDEVIRREKTIAANRDIARQGTRRVDRYQEIQAELGEDLSWQQKQKNWLNKIPWASNYFNFAWTPFDWMFVKFDQRHNGALYRNLKLPFDDVNNDALSITNAYQKRLVDLVNKHNLDEKNFERIQVYAELQQRGGLELLKENGYSDKEINSARTLTRPELEYYREGRKVTNEWFPKVRDVLAKHFHKILVEEPNHWPRQRDWEEYNMLSIEDGRFADVYRRTSAEPGAVIERKPGAKPKIIFDAHQTMMNHIQDMVYHGTVGPELKRIADLVRSDEFQGHVGTWGQQQFADWVDVLARNGGAIAGRQLWWLDQARKNVGIMGLGWRLTTMALQPLSFIQGLTLTTSRNMGRALTSMADKANRDWILNNFPEIKNTLLDDPAYGGYTGKSIRDVAARTAFIPLRELDGFARMTVAEAAYRDYLEKRGIPFDRNVVNRDAMLEAQRVVRLTQAVSFPKDLPLALSHGNFTKNTSIDRAIGQFSNYVIFRWNLFKTGGLQIGIKEKDPKAAAKVLSFLLLTGIAEQLGREGIANVIRATMGEGEEQERRRKKEEKEKSLVRRIAERSAYDLATSVPVLGNVAGMIRYNSGGVPVYDTLNKTVKEATNIFRAKTPTRRAIGAVRTAQLIGGGGLGLPTGQIGDLAVRWLQDYERRHRPIQTVPVTSGTGYERRARESGAVPATIE